MDMLALPYTLKSTGAARRAQNRMRMIRLWLAIALSWLRTAGAATPEVEPNGSPATATSLALGGGFASVSASIAPVADRDYFSFIAPAGARRWPLVDTGGTPGPGSTSTDSVLDLYASNGSTLIESDDDDGVGNGCDSSIENHSGSAIVVRILVNGGNY